MADQQVNTTSGGGMYALLIVIVILIIGAVLYFGGIVGNRGDKTTDINVKVETPNTGGGTGGK